MYPGGVMVATAINGGEPPMSRMLREAPNGDSGLRPGGGGATPSEKPIPDNAAGGAGAR